MLNERINLLSLRPSIFKGDFQNEFTFLSAQQSRKRTGGLRNLKNEVASRFNLVAVVLSYVSTFLMSRYLI
jgi:hypothetical protein